MGSLGICRDAGAPAAVVVNAAPPAGAPGRASPRGAEVAPVTIGQRVAHVRAFAGGMTAAEVEPTGKAPREVAALYGWIMEAPR